MDDFIPNIDLSNPEAAKEFGRMPRKFWQCQNSACAKVVPSITASAPLAMALQISPPVRMPPSVMIGTYRPVRWKYSCRAAAHSKVAVTCGTPTPVTSRVVQAAPGPTPTNTP